MLPAPSASSTPTVFVPPTLVFVSPLLPKANGPLKVALVNVPAPVCISMRPTKIATFPLVIPAALSAWIATAPAARPAATLLVPT